MASQVAGYIGKIDPGDEIQYSLGSTAYGVCDTAADTVAKTVDMTGFTLMTGATIHVQFTNGNNAYSPTLNVNSTGAYPILLDGSNTMGWSAGSMLTLTYNGTGWKQVVQEAIAQKTFTGIIGTANSTAGASFYFGTAIPDEYTATWGVIYRVYAVAAGDARAKAMAEVEIDGSSSTILSYKAWNTIINSDYRPAHYHIIYRAKEAGITNGYGHAFGVSMYSAWKRTTSANARTFTIEILKCINCKFKFYDNMMRYASIPGTGSTNYDTYSNINFNLNGLQETGDDNDNTKSDVQAHIAQKTGSVGVWKGGLAMYDGNGTFQSICTASDGTVTSSNITTDTTKIANTHGFELLSPVFYTYDTYAANSDITAADIVWNSRDTLDSRYSLNTTLTENSLTPYEPVYLKGSVSNGLYYLDTVWWTQTPNDVNKIYVLVGGCYDSTTSNCRIILLQHNQWLRYDGSNLVPYIPGDQLLFKNVSITFALDTSQGGSWTYENFPYRAAYSDVRITSDMMPIVAYSLEQAVSQIFAPVCETYNGGVYLYATEGGTVTIPSITIQR